MGHVAPEKCMNKRVPSMLRRLSPLLLVAIAVGLVLWPARAMAHAGHSGLLQTYTQAVGPYELAITIEMPPSVPAPLYLDISPQTDIGGTTITFRAVPRGQSFANAPVAQINGIAGPQGIYFTELQVDRGGDWDLEVRTSGPRGSGVAHIPFAIVIAPAAAPVAPPGLGTRTVAGMQVNVSSSVTPFKAGKQATLTFSFAADGQPVSDLQPWLGMAGHLIARGADGAIYGHIHAIGPMAPTSPTSSGVIYGPDVSFVYTFPQAGRYQLWAQFKHNGIIVTVPVLIEVK